jgi:hypothetical protein
MIWECALVFRQYGLRDCRLEYAGTQQGSCFLGGVFNRRSAKDVIFDFTYCDGHWSLLGPPVRRSNEVRSQASSAADCQDADSIQTLL